MQDPKYNGNSAAFPGPVQMGLIKLELLAALAPKAPAWWPEVTEARDACAAKQPKYPAEVCSTASETQVVSAWVADPCWDLPEHLAWYQKEWEAYHAEKDAAHITDRLTRESRWRVHYAKSLLLELSKEA